MTLQELRYPIHDLSPEERAYAIKMGAHLKHATRYPKPTPPRGTSPEKLTLLAQIANVIAANITDTTATESKADREKMTKALKRKRKRNDVFTLPPEMNILCDNFIHEDITFDKDGNAKFGPNYGARKGQLNCNPTRAVVVEHSPTCLFTGTDYTHAMCPACAYLRDEAVAEGMAEAMAS